MPEDENTVLLREILKWIKISGLKEVKSLLDLQVQTAPKKQVYHLSDGTKGTQEISEIVGGLSHQTVANYWKDWTSAGLGELIPTRGGSRFKRSFDLTDFGIEIPSLKTPVQSAVQVYKEGSMQSASEVGSNA